ncbi:MAG: amidohydrolase [Actinomycetota bacterium]
MPADLAFVSGAIWTVDPGRPRAEAVAISGGRIVAVGTDDEIRAHVDATTQIHDLRGRSLLPGFQDAHVHPAPSGVEMLNCDLSEAHSIAEYREIIARYAAEHPDNAWIRGGGWSMDVFPRGIPTKEELDAIVPDRPVYLPNRDGHGAWVNTRALELAGVTRDTPDPEDGRIERDAAGEAVGTLQEGATDLVGKLLPAITDEQWLQGLLTAQAHLHSLGITAWQDAIVGGPYDSFAAHRTAAERGLLTARVVGALWWERSLGIEQIDGLIERRTTGSVGRFAPTSVKIMQDGVCENFTAGMLDPYLGSDGTPTSERGKSFVDPERLKGYVRALAEAGFQAHFHAIGDRAVRECLDAIEAASDVAGSADLRHHISHIQVVHPDDIPRFAALGAVANGQPLWAAYEPQMSQLTIPFLGQPRASWQYPFGSLLRSGARLAFGSDWSVSSPDPLEEIHVAVNRMQPADYPYGSDDPLESEPFLPEERISLAAAVEAFTLGTAYVNHLDEQTGTITEGKLADLAVLDRDLFEEGDEHISEASVELTLVEGDVVYEAPSFR